MPWVRFDDQYPIHRKVAGLSDRAFRLHTEAVFWCARNLTDGHISAQNLQQVLPGSRPLTRHAAALVSQHLWHIPGEDCDSEKCPAPLAGDGWVIHDYWDYQPSKEQVMRERAANARRQRQWREAHAGDRNGVTGGVTNTVSHGVSNAVSNSAPARPYIGTGPNQGDSPARARARPDQNSNGQVNPADGAAARHPSARTLAEAARAAGLEPGQQPARGDTVAHFADEIRRAINAKQDP